MSAINPKEFKRLCDEVWNDRATILTGRGILSGEAALIRAVYWRLRKAGVEPNESIGDIDEEHMLLSYQRLVSTMLTQYAHPPFDGASCLKELARRYMDESRADHSKAPAIV